MGRELSGLHGLACILVPLAKTPAWTVVVLDASRKAIMLDPAWKNGDYAEPPEQGIRLWRDILGFLSARAPEMYRDQFQNPMDVLPWLQAQETAQIKLFDANDWIYQTWAYERHDVGTTPGMNGDTAKALRAIKAKTLIMVGTKDLLNPEYEPQDAARFIRDVRVTTINPGTVTGHASAGGGFSGGCRFPEPGDFAVLRPRDPEWTTAELSAAPSTRMV